MDVLARLPEGWMVSCQFGLGHIRIKDGQLPGQALYGID